MRFATLILLGAFLAGAKTTEGPKDAGTFFDDFSYQSAGDLAARGWTVRSAPACRG